MPYKDKQKQKEYARQWVAKRRAEYFADKRCQHCDSTERLELDHIDPSTKVSHNIWSWSETRRQEELAKCQILCKLCHWQKTLANDRHRTTHGTNHMYGRLKCRCDECREFKRLDDYKRRSKKNKSE